MKPRHKTRRRTVRKYPLPITGELVGPDRFVKEWQKFNAAAISGLPDVAVHSFDPGIGIVDKLGQYPGVVDIPGWLAERLAIAGGYVAAKRKAT